MKSSALDRALSRWRVQYIGQGQWIAYQPLGNRGRGIFFRSWQSAMDYANSNGRSKARR